MCFQHIYHEEVENADDNFYNQLKLNIKLWSLKKAKNIEHQMY